MARILIHPGEHLADELKALGMSANELTSIAPDKNDQTGEKGYWMNRGDGENLGGFFGHVNNVREYWK